jgi:predicted transcriptional regulator
MAAHAGALEAHTMYVPSDLASRLSRVAVSSGRSPEALLREAISRLIESTVESLAGLEDGPQHAGFVPQPQSFSVYE